MKEKVSDLLLTYSISTICWLAMMALLLFVDVKYLGFNLMNLDTFWKFFLHYSMPIALGAVLFKIIKWSGNLRKPKKPLPMILPLCLIGSLKIDDRFVFQWDIDQRLVSQGYSATIYTITCTKVPEPGSEFTVPVKFPDGKVRFHRPDENVYPIMI